MIKKIFSLLFCLTLFFVVNTHAQQNQNSPNINPEITLRQGYDSQAAQAQTHIQKINFNEILQNLSQNDIALLKNVIKNMPEKDLLKIETKIKELEKNKAHNKMWLLKLIGIESAVITVFIALCIFCLKRHNECHHKEKS